MISPVDLALANALLDEPEGIVWSLAFLCHCLTVSPNFDSSSRANAIELSCARCFSRAQLSEGLGEFRWTALLVSNARNAWFASDHSPVGSGVLDQLGCRSDRTTYQLAATISADESELCRGALEAIGALESADEGFLRFRWKVAIAAFTVWAKFE
jgi:hypothetical protein